MLLTITPNPALDRIITLSSLMTGAVNRASDVRVSAGGKGINVARAARALGGDVLACAPLGGLNGARLTALCADEGLRLRPYTVSAETRTATILLHDTDKMTVINEPGQPLDTLQWARFVGSLQAAFDDAAALCICGSYPPHVDEIGVRGLINLARHSKKPLWIDGSGVGLAVAYAIGALNLKINGAEIGALLGRTVDDADSALAAAADAHAHTRGAVVVTLGARGAVMVSDAGRFIATPPPITPINTIGSGDSFLAALAMSGAAADGLRGGVAAGTANAITECGGGHFTRASFESILEQVQVSAV